MSELTRCTLYLIALDASFEEFRQALRQATPQPFVAAKVIHWVVPPEVYSVDALLQHPPWDVALCYSKPSTLPDSLQQLVRRTWTVDFNAPSAMVTGYATTQAKFASEGPPRSKELDQTASSTDTKIASAQTLDITPDLRDWMYDFSSTDKEFGQSPITMLNLHAYKDVEKYAKYREAFGSGVGSRHGVGVKLFGQTAEASSDGEKRWELMALVHYPSALHFGDMLASEDYQEISHKFREGSLIDNPLLCLSEFDIGSRN